MPITPLKLKKIIQKYAETLRAGGYPVEKMYLFGSQVNGKAHKDSDIDVAVVSNKLRRNKEKNRLKLWKLKMSVDLRIEPHGFTVEEFNSKEDPMVHEIRTTGVRVV
jgi:predicted nucleotidyltransferase